MIIELLPKARKALKLLFASNINMQTRVCTQSYFDLEQRQISFNQTTPLSMLQTIYS